MATYVYSQHQRLDIRGLVSSTSAGVDSRFEASIRWSDEHAETVLSVPASEYRFYVCADIHIWRTAKRFSSFLRVAQEDENSCFSLILGDVVTGEGSFPIVADTLSAFRRGSYRHCILFTHTNLFKTGNAQTSSGNLPAEEVYALTELCARNEVTLLLQGHDHVRGERKFKGTTYLVLDALSDESKSPSYCVVTCGDEVRYSYSRNI